MNALQDSLRVMLANGRLDLPLPGRGATAARHRMLLEIGREDLSLARLAEAHVDAVAILSDAGRKPVAGALYGVWAAETANQAVQLDTTPRGLRMSGTKSFCSGAGLVDRALVTVTVPERRLVDVDVAGIAFDTSAWKAAAFAGTQTGSVEFRGEPVDEDDLLGPTNWYLDRPGFWHGACGPASCWTGGAIGLVDYARAHARDDPHSRAHLGAMEAAEWALRALLDSAGRQIDENPASYDCARKLALKLRHSVEQLSLDIHRRFARSLGPRPLAYDEPASRRYQELELYVRQCHGERDLETISG